MYMRKVVFLLFLIFFSTSVANARQELKLDVNSGSFLELGRYVQTLEINEIEETKNDSEKQIIQENVQLEHETFEQESLQDLAKKYEEQAVELSFDDEEEKDVLSEINQDRLFKLKINETQYNIERNIKAENMIWDSSKLFTQAFVYESKKISPIPGYFNSSSIEAQVTPDLSAKVGQTYLFDSLGPSVLFVRANESRYNTGSVVSYKGDGLNIAVGSFSASYNHTNSGGVILASDSIFLPKNAGSFVLGGAYFSNEDLYDNKSTGGAFAEYTYKRLKLNAQVGKSKYQKSLDYDTSLYLQPELKLTDSISVKSRIIRNVTSDILQDEFAISYKPKNNKRDFEFEINASNQYTQASSIKKILRLSTSFRI